MAGYQTLEARPLVSQLGAPAAPLVDRGLIEAPRLSRKRSNKIRPKCCTMAEIRKVEPEPGQHAPKRMLMSELFRIITQASGIGSDIIKGGSREPEPLKARLIFYWLARRYTHQSSPRIASAGGVKDHTTVLSGVRRVDRVAVIVGISHEVEPAVVAKALWDFPWPRATA